MVSYCHVHFGAKTPCLVAKSGPRYTFKEAESSFDLCRTGLVTRVEWPSFRQRKGSLGASNAFLFLGLVIKSNDSDIGNVRRVLRLRKRCEKRPM